MLCVMLMVMVRTLFESLQRLLTKIEDLSKQLQMKDLYQAAMVHELRNPLNSVIGGVGLLNESKQINEDDKSTLQIVHHSATILLSLIGNILDVAKLEVNKVDLYQQYILIRPSVKQILDLVEFNVKKKDLSLNLVVDSDVPDYIFLDQSRFNQIILNLLQNAVKFTNKGFVNVLISYEQPNQNGHSMISNITKRNSAPGGFSHSVSMTDLTNQESQNLSQFKRQRNVERTLGFSQSLVSESQFLIGSRIPSYIDNSGRACRKSKNEGLSWHIVMNQSLSTPKQTSKVFNYMENSSEVSLSRPIKRGSGQIRSGLEGRGSSNLGQRPSFNQADLDLNQTAKFSDIQQSSTNRNPLSQYESHMADLKLSNGYCQVPSHQQPPQLLHYYSMQPLQPPHQQLFSSINPQDESRFPSGSQSIQFQRDVLHTTEIFEEEFEEGAVTPNQLEYFNPYSSRLAKMHQSNSQAQYNQAYPQQWRFDDEDVIEDLLQADNILNMQRNMELDQQLLGRESLSQQVMLSGFLADNRKFKNVNGKMMFLGNSNSLNQQQIAHEQTDEQGPQPRRLQRQLTKSDDCYTLTVNANKPIGVDNLVCRSSNSMQIKALMQRDHIPSEISFMCPPNKLGVERSPNNGKENDQVTVAQVLHPLMLSHKQSNISRLNKGEIFNIGGSSSRSYSPSNNQDEVNLPNFATQLQNLASQNLRPGYQDISYMMPQQNSLTVPFPGAAKQVEQDLRNQAAAEHHYFSTLTPRQQQLYMAQLQLQHLQHQQHNSSFNNSQLYERERGMVEMASSSGQGFGLAMKTQIQNFTDEAAAIKQMQQEEEKNMGELNSPYSGCNRDYSKLQTNRNPIYSKSGKLTTQDPLTFQQMQLDEANRISGDINFSPLLQKASISSVSSAHRRKSAKRLDQVRKQIGLPNIKTRISDFKSYNELGSGAVINNYRIDILKNLSPQLESRQLPPNAPLMVQDHKLVSENLQHGVLRIQIQDSGIGIKEEDQKKLFQPFCQANKSIQSKFGGTGLGLWISNKLISLMKGTMTLKSTPGVGTTFTIEMPTDGVSFEDTNNKNGESSSIINLDENLSKLSILVLIQDEFNKEILKKFLTKLNCQVSFAKHYDDFQSKMRLVHFFNVLIVDADQFTLSHQSKVKKLIKQKKAIEQKTKKNLSMLILSTLDIDARQRNKYMNDRVIIFKKPVKQNILRNCLLQIQKKERQLGLDNHNNRKSPKSKLVRNMISEDFSARKSLTNFMGDYKLPHSTFKYANQHESEDEKEEEKQVVQQDKQHGSGVDSESQKSPVTSKDDKSSSTQVNGGSGPYKMMMKQMKSVGVMNLSNMNSNMLEICDHIQTPVFTRGHRNRALDISKIEAAALAHRKNMSSQIMDHESNQVSSGVLNNRENLRRMHIEYGAGEELKEEMKELEHYQLIAQNFRRNPQHNLEFPSFQRQIMNLNSNMNQAVENRFTSNESGLNLPNMTPQNQSSNGRRYYQNEGETPTGGAGFPGSNSSLGFQMNLALRAETFNAKSILIADDEETNRFVIRLMLLHLPEIMQQQIHILEARDGIEGLETYQHHHAQIKLVLTDLHMPQMDGKEMALKIREFENMKRFTQPVLIVGITGDDISDPMFKRNHTRERSGINQLCTKPVTKSILHQIVQQVFSTSHS